MARIGHQSGDIEAYERRFIDRVFTLDRLRAREIMHGSLNGFLLGELGRVPETGEVVEHGDVRIRVVASTDTQVTRARIRRR